MNLWFTSFLDKDVPLVHIFPGQRCNFGSQLSGTKMYLWFTFFLDKDVPLVHIFPGQNMYLWFTAFLDKGVPLVHIFPGQLFLFSFSLGKRFTPSIYSFTFILTPWSLWFTHSPHSSVLFPVSRWRLHFPPLLSAFSLSGTCDLHPPNTTLSSFPFHLKVRVIYTFPRHLFFLFRFDRVYVRLHHP